MGCPSNTLRRDSISLAAEVVITARACYKKHKEEEGKKLTRQEITKLCNNSSLGWCPGCETLVCKNADLNTSTTSPEI